VQTPIHDDDEGKSNKQGLNSTVKPCMSDRLNTCQRQRIGSPSYFVVDCAHNTTRFRGSLGEYTKDGVQVYINEGERACRSFVWPHCVWGMAGSKKAA